MSLGIGLDVEGSHSDILFTRVLLINRMSFSSWLLIRGSSQKTVSFGNH